jgi:hypothetical protein
MKAKIAMYRNFSFRHMVAVPNGKCEGRRTSHQLAPMNFEGSVEAFHRDGIAVVSGFATSSECKAMMQRMFELIDAWTPPQTAEIFR